MACQRPHSSYLEELVSKPISLNMKAIILPVAFQGLKG